MKKLTILLLLFIVFAFAEWDVDPDATDFTADTIRINDYIGMGDTLQRGAFQYSPASQKWRFCGDTLMFRTYWHSSGQWLGNDNKIWGGEGSGKGLYLQSSGSIILSAGGTNLLHIGASLVFPEVDTSLSLGYETWRFRDLHTRHLFLTSPNTADSMWGHMEDDTMYYDSENINKFNNDMFIDGEFETSGKILVGAGDSLTKFVKIGSHCAVVVNEADTFWLAADTSGF